MVRAKIAGLLLITLPVCAQVSVTRQQNAVRIDVNGQPFTSFVYGPDVRSVLRRAAVGVGRQVTRARASDAAAGESVDHPHQKGLYLRTAT
jgi:hypothetical protein